MTNDDNGIGNPKTIAEIFKKLNNTNVNEHLEKKYGDLLFLNSWRAVGLVKEIDPGFTYRFKSFSGKGVQKYPADGEGYNTTAEVACTINCCGYEFEMWLPVMDFKNKSIVNPTSRDINDAKARCLVKNISLNLGLGAYVYQGFKEPGQLKLENGVHSTSNDDSFAPMNSSDATPNASHKFTSTASVGVVTSPKDNGDVRNSIVIIGYGAGEKTYTEVYGSNLKNVDSQIEWVKANGNGDKATQHLANLTQYRLLLSADHAGV